MITLLQSLIILLKIWGLQFQLYQFEYKNLIHNFIHTLPELENLNNDNNDMNMKNMRIIIYTINKLNQ